MSPEEDVINSSSLTKFRKLLLKATDLLNLLISKTVTVAIEKGAIRSKSIIVDVTHTLSRSNPFSAMEVLKERSKQLRKTIDLNAESKNRENYLKGHLKELDENLDKLKRRPFHKKRN